jgi:hypothetical protein
VSDLRKERDYEDGRIPAWARDWMEAHPGDAREAHAIFDPEPRPAHRVPKGKEKE